MPNFKTPYRLGDLAHLPFEKKLELIIQAEVGFIGWGFLLVTRDGVDGPPMVDTCPFPEGYKRAGLEDLIQRRCSNISRTVKYAVDIFIDPIFLDSSTVEVDPDSDVFPISRFIDRPNAYMILANGHRRIQCVMRMLSDRQNTADEAIPWLAKFYDLGETWRIFLKIRPELTPFRLSQPAPELDGGQVFHFRELRVQMSSSFYLAKHVHDIVVLYHTSLLE